MSGIDVEGALREISAANPCGESIEQDPVYIELEVAIEGTPAVELEGKIIQEAREPNWSDVKESALDLLTRSHDLRVAVFLARALLRTDGIQGLSDGFGLINGYVDRYWETFYPRLDPEDDFDPTERVNILEALGDWNTIIGPLMKLSLCSSRITGPISLRDYRIAAGRIGELTVPAEERESAPNVAAVEDAFAGCDLEKLQEDAESAASAFRGANHLLESLEKKIGSGMLPDIGKLIQVLGEINAVFREQLSKRIPSPAPPAPSEESEERTEQDRPETVSGEQSGNLSGGGGIGMIESREDVIHALDQICLYYQLFEPNSPVPLLLKRATRLVNANFFEIIEDLAPDSITQIEAICGGREKE